MHKRPAWNPGISSHCMAAPPQIPTAYLSQFVLSPTRGTRGTSSLPTGPFATRRTQVAGQQDASCTRAFASSPLPPWQKVATIGKASDGREGPFAKVRRRNGTSDAFMPVQLSDAWNGWPNSSAGCSPEHKSALGWSPQNEPVNLQEPGWTCEAPRKETALPSHLETTHEVCWTSSRRP